MAGFKYLATVSGVTAGSLLKLTSAQWGPLLRSNSKRGAVGGAAGAVVMQESNTTKVLTTMTFSEVISTVSLE